MASQVETGSFARYLQDAIIEVFEKMAFMFGETLAGGKSPAAPGEIVATMVFTGSAGGLFTFSCSRRLARTPSFRSR